ncbi:hypothetical protein [Desulfosporosinus lacus]|uniref:XRE family transcriptional regulator n=1 Tax=Desulfosporosinus lacus DSM 15449 TaxID=1121420 RepID=A0A1M5WFW1_9FIRM|nr:hypothetical protein [Desulfosporosinus lacus]SHH86327.1 hypothetical protein SAMN02746098_01597 [Desulfosporosinus lacus DSM 15449]
MRDTTGHKIELRFKSESLSISESWLNAMFKNLKAEMARIPLSGKDVADTIGITPQAFYDKMSGRSEFKRSEMFKIQELFFMGLLLDYLFRWDLDNKDYN